jgi:hypothetical protein
VHLAVVDDFDDLRLDGLPDSGKLFGLPVDRAPGGTR